MSADRVLLERLVKTLEGLAATEQQAAWDASSDWWRGMKEGKSSAFSLAAKWLREDIGAA